MKHPRLTEQQILDRASGQIPWSAAAERGLRQQMTRAWYEMWICYLLGLVFGALAFLVHHLMLLSVGAFFAAFGLTRLYALALLREKLGEEMRRGPRGEFFEGSGMLANKPRSTSRLTKWIQHVPESIDFICFDPDVAVVSGAKHVAPRCGEHHHWKDAQWVPNFDPDVFEPEEHPGNVDPGGGRFVILCPCGLGHFKLKGN